MIPHLLFLLFLLSAPASAVEQAQKLLQDTTGTKITHELTLAAHLHYMFPPSQQDPFSHKPPLDTLQDLDFYAHANLSASVIYLPANAAHPGHVVFSTLARYPPAVALDEYEDEDEDEDEDDADGPAATMLWLEAETRAERIPLTDMGVRKHGMVSMAVQSARLDLGTPFVAVPKQMWEVVVLATRPRAEGSRWWVECERRGVFPDLVFREGEEDGEEEKEELVVTPWQYVLEVGEGRCLLLAREMEGGGGGGLREDVVLGWSAVRGRRVVIDAVGKRMGIRR